eukprot:TRINITY_DN403_c0_g1_i1.p3 TRINITY_DN403_c0_g1~~TRINITY_DN403_c0_g1_i1.p3  ORF type:complete len:83 (-),score=18.58 TRINITY_DN403_c0_g1_i1:281-529(-)
MIFGIDKSNPIDRTGTHATNSTDVGTVNWDPEFKNPYPTANIANCVVELCDKTDIKNTDLELGGAAAGYRTNCLMRDFKTWS